MKKLLLLMFGIALACNSAAMALDIAISTQAGWWGQADADREMQEIVDNVTGANVELFTPGDQAALASWVADHTGDGVSDLLIMCGQFPDTIYGPGNTQADDSLAELFLDDGNTIINTGDYMFYVVNGAGTNATGGLQTMMDIPNIDMWDLGQPMVVTPEGQQFTPSLQDGTVTRPWHLDQLEGTDWEPELILRSDGANGADPAIIINKVTGGRLGTFIQVANADTDLRGEVISEWINNWYLKNVADPALAGKPVPETDTIDVSRDIDLSWKAGKFAVAHDVYIGTTWEDVNDATTPNSAAQTGTSFNPGRLELGQSYFWRVDEVNGAPDRTVFKGDIWTFEVEPVGYPITNVTATASSAQSAAMGPEKTVDGSGLNELDQHSTLGTDMWLSGVGDPTPSLQYEFDMVYKLHEMMVWNSNQLIEAFVGLGAKDVVIETSIDGAEWVVLEGATRFNQATGSADYTANTVIDFAGVMAKYVKITVNAGWGLMPQYGISEVRFSFIPTFVREPQPADGSTTDGVNVVLGWRAGREAATHEVYLGTDSTDLPLLDTVTDNSLDLSDQGLAYATTYFWTVKEVNEAETPAAHEGPVWSFTTPDFGTVDDFEQYDDTCNRIFFAWEDGLGHNGGTAIDNCDVPESNGNGGGSIVGNAQAPFAERTVVYLGSTQSLPFDYDNAFGDSYATLDIDGQDWTTSGIQTLGLAFRGETGNTGSLYIKINNTKISYDGPASDIGNATWMTWNIVLADTGANLGNVTSFEIGVDGANAAGKLYFDNIRLHPKIFAPSGTGLGIAISTQANWWGQAAADREVQEIMNNVPEASVKAFTASDQDALADWVIEHTGNGVANLLILCGQLPDTIYEPGNTQIDDSLIELFLDDGNTIINTGDWIFYVVNGAGTNAAGGLQTIMDIPGVTVAGEDNTAVVVTAEGQQLTPSLQDLATDRPFHLDTLEGDWEVELALAQNAAGTRADPVIVHNAVTGGRIGIFYQTASQDDDPRGEVISEWINNWYLDVVSGGGDG